MEDALNIIISFLESVAAGIAANAVLANAVFNIICNWLNRHRK